MAMFITGVIVTILFLALGGAWGLVRLFDAIKGSARKALPPAIGTHPRTQHPKLRILMQILSDRGLLGAFQLPAERLSYIEDPVLAEMIEALDREENLLWLLPTAGLQLLPTSVVESHKVQPRYVWGLATRSHLIGFNRKLDFDLYY